MPVVGVYFKDVHGVEYDAVSRPGFENEVKDIRTGKSFRDTRGTPRIVTASA